MDSTTERAIADRARDQLGVLTRDQLGAAGLDRRSISRRVAAGLLVPVGTRTLRLGAHPRSMEAEVLAACLDVDGVASHRTAAWLHGLLGAPGPIIDVTVAKGRSSGSHGRPARWRVHTSTNIPVDDVVAVGAIPTTSVARTLLGLAALRPDEVTDCTLTSTIEDAVRRRLASDRWLWWLLEARRCRGRNGVSRFEAVLAERSRLGPTESWLERELLDVLRRAGLPLPVVQRTVRQRGAFVARVDAAYPDERIVLEALGYASHASRQALSADAARASRLTLMGLDVHQFTYDQIVRDPAWVVGVVRAALESAAGSGAAQASGF